MYIIANECPGFYLPPVMLVLTNDMVRKVRMVFERMQTWMMEYPYVVLGGY